MVMSCSLRLVDGYINSIEVVFNKIERPSRGGTTLTVEMRDARRKLPAERRGELLAKAVEISEAEGLSEVTLRRVATDLGVTPGLVSHYFSSAEGLIAAAFRAASTADLDEARARVDVAPTPTAKIDALMDYLLDDVSQYASALWLDAWSLGRRNATLAAEVTALTDDWLAFLGAIVRAGVEAGEFTAADVDVAARRLLIVIDGLGSQKVIRDANAVDLKHIARAYVSSELGLATSPR
jgi:AcrR family transcriptional regulator